jgi:SagB-type dehydrogenase family enzyme
MIKQYPRLNNIYLPEPILKRNDLREIIAKRRSNRKFTKKPISATDLSDILYFSMGISGRPLKDQNTILRMFPSAGAKYPIESYILVHFGDKIIPNGLYHYNPYVHCLDTLLQPISDDDLKNIWLSQPWFKNAAAIIILTAVYGRSTSKYGKYGLVFPYIEAGHIAQNITLIAEANNLVCCPIGQLKEKELAKLLDVQIDKEDPIYYVALSKKLAF